MARVEKFFPKGNDGKKNKNVQCESVAIKRLTGEDEDVAASFAAAKGKPESYAEELIRCSVVEYDGKSVQQPWAEFGKLDLATRTYIGKAFNKVNSVDSDDQTLEDPVPLEV